MKLKTFTNFMPQTAIRLGEKVLKLWEDRELLGRCLIIQTCRPELIPKLDEIIGHHEMGVVPRSICSNDGSLLIPSDKSSLMKVIENMSGPVNIENNNLPTILPIRGAEKISILDAMGALRSAKTAKIKTLSDLSNEFCKRVEHLTKQSGEVHVLFDNYRETSLKTQELEEKNVPLLNQAICQLQIQN